MGKKTNVIIGMAAAGAGMYYAYQKLTKKVAMTAGRRSGGYPEAGEETAAAGATERETLRENASNPAQETVREDLVSVPAEVLVAKDGVVYGELKKYTYYSTTRERETKVNVLLPPDYSPAGSYPVLYALHGFWGNEDSLPGSSKAQVLLGNLVAAGLATKQIIVFPYIYTSKTQAFCTHMDMENALNYDNFIEDFLHDLMPFIEENFAVAKGREATAITGFSMGAREALYIATKCPDKIAYVGSACPAPGLTPGRDAIMGEHPGQLRNEELAFSIAPEVLLLTAGGADTVVCEHPEKYHKLLEQNGVAHTWQWIPEGGHDASCFVPHLYQFLTRIF